MLTRVHQRLKCLIIRHNYNFFCERTSRYGQKCQHLIGSNVSSFFMFTIKLLIWYCMINHLCCPFFVFWILVYIRNYNSLNKLYIILIGYDYSTLKGGSVGIDIGDIHLMERISESSNGEVHILLLPYYMKIKKILLFAWMNKSK